MKESNCHKLSPNYNIAKSKLKPLTYYSCAMAITFQKNGRSKTASAYTCLKICTGQHDYPNNNLKLNIKKMKEYLDTNANTIKEGILTLFNKEEAEKLISTKTNLNEEIIWQLQDNINDIISYSSNKMTTEILTNHKEEVRRHNTIATTEATFSSKKTVETTAAVATALANKGSVY